MELFLSCFSHSLSGEPRAPDPPGGWVTSGLCCHRGFS